METRLILFLIVCPNFQTGHTSSITGVDMIHSRRKREGNSILSIECLKNCPPFVPVCDVHEPIYLEVVCTANCEGMSEKDFLWTVKDNFDYATGADEFGRNMNIFIINANSLTVGKSYGIEVELTGNLTGKAHTLLLTHEAPVLVSAQISSNTGDALKTVFVLECTPKEIKPYVFEIYAVSKNSEFLLQRGKKCNEMPFILSSEVEKVKVKMIDEYQYSDIKTLAVTVNPVLGPVTTQTELENEMQKQYFNRATPNSISNLIESKNYDKLLQVLNVFSDDLEKISKNNDTADSIIKYQTEILNILCQVPMVSRDKTKQAASIAEKISKSFELKSDPDIARVASKLCEQAASKNLEFLQKEAYPKSIELEIQEDSKMFAVCSQAGVAPNIEILEVKETVSEPTTPFPIMEMPSIVEDYPDYVDDQNVSHIMSKYDDSSHSLVRLCSISSSILAQSMSVKDVTKSVTYQHFEVSATKAHGLDIPGTKVSSQKVQLFASQDFLKFGKEEVEILLCTSTKNPFWWTKRQPTITSVAILQFRAVQEIVDKFTNPLSIIFEISDPNSTFVSHSCTFPRAIIKKAGAYSKFAVFRIDVFRKQGYFIEFQELAMNVTLDVYVSVFEKPSVATFEKMSTKIKSNNSIIFVPNEFEYGTWHYLTILPNEIMGDVKVEFNFEVYTTSCYHWDESLRDWRFRCGATESSSKAKINCLCYHSSILTGRIVNNAVREEVDEFVEHELEIQASFLIFLSVAVVFSIYCVILTCLSFTLEDKISGRSIFFLSDVPSFCRFGYLIIVKTANVTNAGTTSNVILKIYGENTESLEHVLNFPDPDKKILQRNQEDWFFLATEYHLGEIGKIELWFDSLGLRPRWYCRDVSIFDLQTNKYWYFNVDFQFELSGNKENHFCVVYPKEPERTTGKTVFFLKKLALGLQGPHMWNIFESDEAIFSKTKRLTIMLSILLTTYSAILFTYGCPKMIASDSLGHFKDYGFHAHVLWASIIGLTTTSIIHVPIVHFFRYCHENTKNGNAERFGKIHKINIACWCSIIILIIVSMTILIILGFWIPHITGLLWLTSCIVSILAYIFLVENITRIVYNFTSRVQDMVNKVFREMKNVVASVEAQRVRIYSRFGHDALRPYYEHLYKPMDEARLKEFEQEADMKQKIIEIVENLMMIMVYVILLYMVILKDKDPMMQLSNEEVNDLVMGVHSRTKTHITNRREIQEYILDTLIFSTQSLQWYGHYVSRDPGMTIDNSNKYIGVARLRQARSDDGDCDVPDDMVSFGNSCVSLYSGRPQRSDFGEAWQRGPTNVFDRMNAVWKYRRVAETGTLGFVGKFGTYPGSGYVSSLGRNMKNSLINANYLFRNKWLDEYTRCLSIEFLMYCTNSNLFNSIEVRFELSTTGYVRSKSIVHTARLLFVKETTSILIWFLLVSFVLVVSILVLKIIVKIVRKKKLIFKDLWYIVDVLIISMSLACIFLYMNRTQLVKTFLKKLENAKHNEFINYFHLFHSDNILTSLAAVLVFLATIRLWKLLRFLLIIRIVEKTLLLSAVPLFCLFLCHLVVLTAFTFTGSILFGDQSFDFKDLPDTLMTMTLLSLCLYGNFDLTVLETPLHYLYYSLYMIISLLIINLFVAIITICYGEAQIYYSNENSYSVFHYLRDQFSYYTGLFQIRARTLRGGSDSQNLLEKPTVSPKADEHRYAKCLTVPKTRISGMVAVALSTLRNRANTDMTTRDREQLMKKTVANLFREESEEQDYFFISNVQGSKASLVDDLKFLKMEKIVTRLLSKSNVPQSKRDEEFYKKILKRNSERMDEMAKNLEVMLDTLKRVEFE